MSASDAAAVMPVLDLGHFHSALANYDDSDAEQVENDADEYVEPMIPFDDPQAAAAHQEEVSALAEALEEVMEGEQQVTSVVGHTRWVNGVEFPVMAHTRVTDGS